MKEVFSTIWQFLIAYPPEILAGAAGILLFVILILVILLRNRHLLKVAGKLAKAEETDPRIRKRLLARPVLMERFIRKNGPEAGEKFGLSEYLEKRLLSKRRAEDAERLLRHAPGTGAFAALLVSLEKKAVAKIFSDWITEKGEIGALRKMALSAKGRDFDGEKSRELLEDRFEEFRELSGDPEWPVRFFSLRLLLTDDDPKSLRLVKEAFADPYPLIRRTVAIECHRPDREFLYAALMDMVLNDPAPEVRQVARDRIDRDFHDLWKLEPEKMNSFQSLHVLELLRLESKEDENLAITALKNESPEAHLAAARFLEKSGGLDRFLNGADRGDRENWERSLFLLERAVKSGVSGFLSALKFTDSVDILLMGASLLSYGGDRRLIVHMVKRSFIMKDPLRQEDVKELYHSVVVLACERGDEEAIKLVRSELQSHKDNHEVLDYILPLLPPGEAEIFKEILLEFLVDPEFRSGDALLRIMADLPSALFLEQVLTILESDRSAYSHAVRLRALQCLGAWGLDQTLQTVLENLTVLPGELRRSFSRNLASMNTGIIRERAALILATPDTGMKAALISCLPEEILGSFKKEIKEGLNDADPEMRISCLRALLDSGDLKATGPALALLRDPLDSVRREAARIAGIAASGKFLEALSDLVSDEQEIESVRIAALDGLVANGTRDSLDALVGFLGSIEDLRPRIIQAMAERTDRKSILALVEHFKDSEAVLRDRISEVFVLMGENGEEALIKLLREEIPSLTPFLADILTRTGFVDSLARKLGYGKPSVRRDAAGLLADIATESAYRGIVLAAKDPDRNVRIAVTRALESLASPESESILNSLQKDPDRKVRKYTLWAMERLKAKKLP